MPASPSEAGGDGPWTVERLVPGGEGLGRAPDGRAFFAPGALPGDEIRPIALDERRRLVRVLAFEQVRPGPDRLGEVPCPVADRCGGCDWMHLARDAQLRWKGVIVADALRRIGGLEAEVGPAVAAGPDLGYRTRLRLHVDRSGRIGLFERGSRRIVAIPGCPVADPAIEAALADVRVASAELPGAFGALDGLELRAPPGGGRVAVRPLLRRGAALSPALREALGRTLDVVDEASPVAHAWPLPGGVTASIPATAFSQVNAAVNDALVRDLVGGATARGARTFLDLYAGAGNFALPLLAAGLSGTAVEADAAAIAAARRAAEEAGLRGGRFLGEPVEQALARLAPTTGGFDLVVLDPPRQGAKEAVAGVVALAPSAVAAVSCDPPTLARDLRALCDGGYRLESVRAFDMFPHTHHVEVLAWLRRDRPES